MGSTAKTMGEMNKLMNPAQVAKTMQVGLILFFCTSDFCLILSFSLFLNKTTGFRTNGSSLIKWCAKFKISRLLISCLGFYIHHSDWLSFRLTKSGYQALTSISSILKFSAQRKAHSFNSWTRYSVLKLVLRFTLINRANCLFL